MTLIKGSEGKIVLLFSATASLVAVLLFVYTQLVYEPPLPNNELEKMALKKDSKKEMVTKSFKVSKLIVNLPSRRTRLRFLAIITHLVPFKENEIKEIKKQETQIKNVIIEQTSKFQANELNTISGKVILEGRLRKALNALFAKEMIKDIYFSLFTVQ